MLKKKKTETAEEKEVEKKESKKSAEERDKSAEDKKSKLSELKKKAKELEKKVEEAKEIDIRKEVKGEKEEKKDTLVPMEDYLKASIHLGTRVITPNMRKYVYRRRADGLAVFNTALLDDKIREGADFLSKFAPENVIVVCKREAGWKAVSKFSEIFGVRAFTKKYPAGILTNTNLKNFFECELVFVCDPWIDNNAVTDANRVSIKVLGICDTNDFTNGITQIIPANNKSAKSLGMIFYLLTKIYAEKRGLKIPNIKIQDFIDDWDEQHSEQRADR